MRLSQICNFHYVRAQARMSRFFPRRAWGKLITVMLGSLTLVAFVPWEHEDSANMQRASVLSTSKVSFLPIWLIYLSLPSELSSILSKRRPASVWSTLWHSLCPTLWEMVARSFRSTQKQGQMIQLTIQVVSFRTKLEEIRCSYRNRTGEATPPGSIWALSVWSPGLGTSRNSAELKQVIDMSHKSYPKR